MQKVIGEIKKYDMHFYLWKAELEYLQAQTCSLVMSVCRSLGKLPSRKPAQKAATGWKLIPSVASAHFQYHSVINPHCTHQQT